jgi:hypothetical protein
MAVPTDDDVYVNDGSSYDNGEYYPQPDKDQVVAEREEAAVTSANYPIMGSVADWFAAAIKSCDSVDNIKLESKVPVEAQLLAYQHLKKLLSAKALEWDEFVPEPSDD